MEILTGVDQILGMYGKFSNFVVSRTSQGKQILRRYVIPKQTITDKVITQRKYFKEACISYNLNIKPFKSRLTEWKRKATKLGYYTAKNCYISAFITRIKQIGLPLTITEGNLNIINIKKVSDNKLKVDKKNTYLTQQVYKYQSKNETIKLLNESRKFINDNNFNNVWDLIPNTPINFILYLELMGIIKQQ